MRPHHPTRRTAIAICGAGPVGLALAAQCLARGIAASQITLIDAKPVSTAGQDPRSIALSYGSVQLLQQLQATPASMTAITQIHVSRRASFGRTLIRCNDYGLPALGYVCRYGSLVQSLNAALIDCGIQSLRPATVSAIDEADDSVHLQCADGTTLTADIVVQAEGGVFGRQTIKTMHRDYQQSALVATVRSSGPIAGRAFERFTDQGPLALLPQDDGYALVWCARPTVVAHLLALPNADFLLALQQAFGHRVGRFIATSPRHSYPLGLNAQPSLSRRTVAIGNAAQTLHPVAGQGLNLGLRDAVVLADALAREVSPAMLTQFGATRRTDRGATLRLTDTMARVFASSADGSLTQMLLGGALALVDVAPPLKRALAGQMMFGWR